MTTQTEGDVVPPEPNGTVVEYLYRDASNWKYWSQFSLTGTLAFAEFENLLHEHLWFVPQAIGVESLTPKIRNQDDHSLHEIHEVRSAPVVQPLMSAEEFVCRLKYAQRAGWFNFCEW